MSYDDVVDLSSAEVRKEVLEGQFLSFTCPACGQTLKIEPRVQLRDGSETWDVYPEMERDHFLAGKLAVDPLAQRVVFGYKEMAEKIHLLEDRLDDRPIEILKYLFLQKQGWPEALVLYYKGCQDDKISFYLEGLKENEIGVTGVPKLYYDKLRDQLSQTEYQELLSGPYISVQKLAKED
ncbi:MAG: hypothetical protein HKM06_00095 [Spirochaetales bacterium]|nr:hypothetical protein [Spirochaetales bacterium]